MSSTKSLNPPPSLLQPISMEIKHHARHQAIAVIHIYYNTTQQGKHGGMWKFTEQNAAKKNNKKMDLSIWTRITESEPEQAA